jgi:hypothetical protein
MKKALLNIMFFLLSLTIAGQEVIVNAEYPAVVNVGQQFSVSWTVNAGGGEFLVPSFEGFTKLMGPQTSYSSSTQYVNGKMSQQTTHTYVYFLQTVKEGKFVIPPARFTLKNKTYSSDSMYIEVMGGNTTTKNPNTQSNRGTGNSQVESNGNDIFLSLILNRKEIYLGEHILATIKLYTRINLSGINEIKYPSFNNFMKTDLETPPLTSLNQENVNGTIYGSGVVQQFLLYPQLTGEIQIEPVQMTVLVQQKSAQTDPFFGDFFSSYQTVPRGIASMATKVKVKPLPGVKPDNFSGIVGKLEIKATINKDSVKVNDAVNYKIVISGSGNLKLATVPILNLSPDLEVYDPKVYDEIKNGPNGTTGKKTFEYLLIPRHNGDFTIPAVTYSYFNSTSGQYEKLTTSEFRFHAKKGNEQNSGITVYGGVSKEEIKYLGKDIRFLKSGTGKLMRTGNFILSKRSFYSAYAFSFFVFLIVLFIRREQIRRNSDLTLVRNRKAGKVAGKRLRSASICLKNNQIDKFYEEILKSLWGYLSDKLNIPVSDLNRMNSVNALIEKGIDENKIDSLTTILDKCEFARFSPSSSGTEAEKIFEGASQFIRSIENSI